MADLYYIEEGYYDAGYFVYTAEADSSLSSESTIACDAAIIAGGEIEIAYSDMESFATISATISHIEGSDLFAFAEAQLTAAVEAIREYNIASSAQFDIATDGRVFRDIESAEFSLFDIVVDNQRSRATEMETQAAFSFDVDYINTRPFDSSINTVSSLSATISHIEGADILLTPFAEITAEANVTAEASVSLDSTALVDVSVFIDVQANSNLTSNTFLAVYPVVYDLRSSYELNSGGVFANTISIDSALTKFGTGSLRIGGAGGVVNHPSQFDEPPILVGSTYYLIKQGLTASTSNGKDWTFSANNLPSDQGRYGDISWDGSQFITATASETGSFNNAVNKIWYSSNGITWTSHTVHDGTNSLVRNGKFNRIQIRKFGAYYYIAYRSFVGKATGRVIARSTTLTGSYTSVLSANISGDSNHSWTSGYSDGSRIGFGYTYDGDSGSIIESTSGNNGTWNFAPNISTVGTISQILYTDRYYANTGGTVYTTSGSNSIPGNRLYYSNGNFYSKNQGTLYGNNSLSSLPAVVSQPNTYDIAFPIFVEGTAHVAYKDKTLVSSNGISNWTDTTVSGISNLPAKLIYTNTDFQSFKTIDFWARTGNINTNGRFLRILSNPSSDYIEFRILNTRLETTVSFSSVSKSLIPSTNTFPANNWNHIRLVSHNGNAAVYVNGSRLDLEAQTGFTFSAVPYVEIFSAGDLIRIDELLISDSVLTDPSVTSFSVPTQRFNSSNTTDLLAHFDGDVIDDTLIAVIPSAVLSTISQLSASVTGTQLLQPLNLISQFDIEAKVNALNDVEITVDNFATLSAEMGFNRSADALIDAEAAVSVDPVKQTDAVVNILSETTQTVDNTRIRDAAADFESITVEMAVVAVIADGIVFQEVLTLMSSTAVKTTNTAALPSVATNLTALESVTRGFSSSLFCEFALSVDAEITVSAEAELAVESQLTADPDISADAIVLTAGEFALTVDASGSAISINAQITATAEISVQPIRIQSLDAQANSEFALEANTFNSLVAFGEADLTVSIEQTAQALRIFDGVITTDSVSAQMTVVVATRAVDVDITVVTEQTTDVVKITDVMLDAVSTVEQSVDYSRLRDNAAVISADSQVSAAATKDTDIQVQLFATFIQTASGVKNTEIVLTAFNDAELTSDVNVQASAQVNMPCSSNIPILAVKRTRAGTASLVFEANLLNNITVDYSPVVALESNTSVAVTGNILHLDLHVYRIPNEQRQFVIDNEQRTYRIASETRTHKVRR